MLSSTRILVSGKLIYTLFVFKTNLLLLCIFTNIRAMLVILPVPNNCANVRSVAGSPCRCYEITFYMFVWQLLASYNCVSACYRELKLQSGEWFYKQLNRRFKTIAAHQINYGEIEMCPANDFTKIFM